MKNTVRLLAATAAALLLSSCGTLTGIPAHGGGKRFAVEQELVSASVRAAVKDMDLAALQGRRVAVHISAMGDQGAGSISGGRYSIDALIRGEYANSPDSRSDYVYPEYRTGARTEADGLTSITDSLSVLNAPSRSRTRSRGAGSSGNLGIGINGLGDYRNETLTTNPRDASYLSGLVQTVFFLRGLDIVPDELADTDVFVNVDVFGTIRSRTEMHVYNAETLRAQTKLEYFAVDRKNKRILIPPKTAAFEAAYQEKYTLWVGPYSVKKNIKPADGLMVDFSDIKPYARNTGDTRYAGKQPESPEEGGNSAPDQETLRRRQENQSAGER